MVLAGDVRKQGMSCVRCSDGAGALFPVQRERVRRDVLAPECALELLLEVLGLVQELGGALPVSEHGRQLRGFLLGGIDVGLHFAQCDRSLCERSIDVEDRVVRVLPSLIDQALG